MAQSRCLLRCTRYQVAIWAEFGLKNTGDIELARATLRNVARDPSAPAAARAQAARTLLELAGAFAAMKRLASDPQSIDQISLSELEARIRRALPIPDDI